MLFRSEIAVSMRALCFYKDSQIQFRVDKPLPVSMIFNNLNVEDGFFSYAGVQKNTRTTSVEVNYLDKRNNFRPRTEFAEDQKGISKFGYLKQYTDSYGITSRAQALRHAKNILFEAQHATETVSFNCGFEGSLLTPGDIIRVDDDLKNIEPNYGMMLKATGFHQYSNGAYGVTGLIVDRQFEKITGLIPTGKDSKTYIH